MYRARMAGRKATTPATNTAVNAKRRRRLVGAIAGVSRCFASTAGFELSFVVVNAAAESSGGRARFGKQNERVLAETDELARAEVRHGTRRVADRPHEK